MKRKIRKVIRVMLGILMVVALFSMILQTTLSVKNVTLETVPSWISSDSDYSRCVAWGDVNNDGNLDLAVGNGGEPNDIYLNIGGTLETTPSWSSLDSKDTYYVAWGDVDNDGDLDLAAANFGIPHQRNVVYFNQYIETGGTTFLETSPSWVSDDKLASRGIAFGDMDKDGDLDLAIGNTGAPIKVYKNLYVESNGTTILETTSSWDSLDNAKAYTVAWGDMDNNGYLDLAVANARKENVVYLNYNGILETSPSWQSSDSDYTCSVAWGDADNDGDLDLAAGNLWDINNVDTSNDVYYNNNGMLETTPSWSSLDIPLTYGIAWGDVDNDGDLDLAAGNGVDDCNTLYLNNNGVLEASPSWSSADSRDTLWIAWGDVDSDGDLDLAAPNRKYNNPQNVIYFNGLLDKISATIDIDPDTLNLKSSGRWITAYITLPNGYDVNNIDISTVILDDVLPAEWGDVQDTTLMVKFDRSDVEDLIGTPREKIELKVTGKLTDGTEFEGSDTIRAIEPP